METTTAKELAMVANVRSQGPLDDQIKFCIDRRLEWEPALTNPGEIGLAAKKNVAMYAAIEGSLRQAQILTDNIEVQYRILHSEPEAKDIKAKSPEQRIRDKKTK